MRNIPLNPQPRGKSEKERILQEFFENIFYVQEPLPPEIQKMVDDNFWELLAKA